MIGAKLKRKSLARLRRYLDLSRSSAIVRVFPITSIILKSSIEFCALMFRDSENPACLVWGKFLDR